MNTLSLRVLRRGFAAWIVMTAALPAAPFVRETFDRGAPKGTSAEAAGLVWFRNNPTGATLAVADDASVFPANKALVLTATSNFRGLLAFFPLQRLAIGQTLTLRFDFRFTTAPESNAQSFRFGLYNSNGTRQTADAGSATRGDDSGYGLWTNAAADSSDGTRVFVESAAPGDDILGGEGAGAPRSVGAGGSAYACGTANRHTAFLRIRRLATGGVELEGRLDQGTAARATITTPADEFYSFDEVALTNGGAAPTSVSFLIDNVTLTLNTPPAVILTAPSSDQSFAAPATFALAASASDPSAVAKVEFFRGATKIGEATTAPYTFTWTNAAPGVFSLTAVATDDDGDSAASAPVDVRVTGGKPDEFDTLRDRWLTQLMGHTPYDLGDPEIVGRITQLTTTAQTPWDAMLKTGGNTRPELWSDAASRTVSAHITTCYSRLRSMALAYATPGSRLQGNAALLADIFGALDWLNANRYFEKVTPYDNWYDWEIGTPRSLNDLVVLLYPQLSPTRLMNQMRAVERFAPTAEVFTFANTPSTGANRTNKACVVAVRGAIVKDSAKLLAARDALSPVFQYVTVGDGFHADGSFIQHTSHPYNGDYGADLLDSLGLTLALTDRSTWAVVDPNAKNLYRWIQDSYAPFIFRGAFMDGLRGRGVSRSTAEDHVAGHGVVASILRVTDFAPAAEALAGKQMAKAWIIADTERNFLTTATLPAVQRAKAVLAAPAIAARREPVMHRQFPEMDRVVHWRPGFAFAVSMSSSRISNYESINGENLHGWHQGEGASYLYNADLEAYGSGYWPTVNSSRLAGLTVDSLARPDAAAPSTPTGRSWAGGAEILGLYGSAGLELAASGSTLTARKSWFMFDDEIVALGSAITSTDGGAIETIVENRRLKTAISALTIDGAAKPTARGWSETMTGVGWAHLEGTGGYVFPGGANLKGLRETRTGAWRDINANGSTTPITNDFATLWFDHGAKPSAARYAYIELPTRSVAATRSYAANPEVIVLENSPAAHAVREKRLNLFGVHFWEDQTHAVGGIASNKKAALLIHETAAQLELALSDPTQLNTGTITIELARPAAGLISADPEIKVEQLAPTIRFSASVKGTRGRSLKAVFALPPGRR